MSVFKENDIRGLYPEEWNNETVSLIAEALPGIMKGERFVIGMDGRDSSHEIRDTLVKGLLEKGIDVTVIGVVDTPAVYFSVGNYSFDGGIMITASHNPAGYNGLKLTGQNVAPIEYETGIRELEIQVNKLRFLHTHQKETKSSSINPGTLSEMDITSDYVAYLEKFKINNKECKVIFDCSNGSAGRFINQIVKGFPGTVKVLNSEIDGSFPNHGPNPSVPENLEQLKKSVLDERAEIGFCFDGDGDRVVMIDERGEIVSPDLITAILGIYYLKYSVYKDDPRLKVLVDIRSSRNIRDFLIGMGADVETCPVGHAKIKKQMRGSDALFAGELTGHYYFKENYFSDSPWLTIFQVLGVLSFEKKSLKCLKEEILKYEFSGELNYKIDTDVDATIQYLVEKYSEADISLLDGYKFDYPDWWFIIRKSGTEPLLRLVAEAKTKDLLESKLKDIIPVLEGRILV
ncbi:MAG: phosphomannomutase/phosphoglucomutase [Spirochaetales bacterium]|nr:phosphomannomutase/phosphoglucomutase [Spirochaetales bacterium]